jgi:hypothetical protein
MCAEATVVFQLIYFELEKHLCTGIYQHKQVHCDNSQGYPKNIQKVGL